MCTYIYIYCIYETVCYHGTHTLGNLKYCTLRNYQGGICLSQSIATSLINQKHAWSIPLHKINPHETGCMDNFFCQSFVGLDWSFEVFLSCQVVTDLDCLHGYSQRFWTVQFRKVLGLIFVGWCRGVNSLQGVANFRCHIRNCINSEDCIGQKLLKPTEHDDVLWQQWTRHKLHWGKGWKRIKASYKRWVSHLDTISIQERNSCHTHRCSLPTVRHTVRREHLCLLKL